MRVNKQVSINVDSGTKQEIINALSLMEIPEKATLKDCDVESFEVATYDEHYSIVKKVWLFFEWEDDE